LNRSYYEGRSGGAQIIKLFSRRPLLALKSSEDDYKEREYWDAYTKDFEDMFAQNRYQACALVHHGLSSYDREKHGDGIAPTAIP
jgi:hypothetical protein